MLLQMSAKLWPFCLGLILSLHFKNAYELINLRALKILMLYKKLIFQCIWARYFVWNFKRVPLKFHTKYLTHTLKDVDVIHGWQELMNVSEMPPGPLTYSLLCDIPLGPPLLPAWPLISRSSLINVGRREKRWLGLRSNLTLRRDRLMLAVWNSVRPLEERMRKVMQEPLR